MNQKDGHSELCMVDLIPFRPVLTTHHGSQDKWRHIEGIALLQQLLFFGTLVSKSSSKRKREKLYNTEVCLSLPAVLDPYKCSSYLRKLQARQGDKQ